MRFKYFFAAVSSLGFKNIFMQRRHWKDIYELSARLGAGGGGGGGSIVHCKQTADREEKRQQSIVSFFVLTLVKICLI